MRDIDKLRLIKKHKKVALSVGGGLIGAGIIGAGIYSAYTPKNEEAVRGAINNLEALIELPGMAIAMANPVLDAVHSLSTTMATLGGNLGH